MRLDRLQLMVEHQLSEGLEPSNVVSVYQLSKEIRVSYLESVCKYFILVNWDSVKKEPDWNNLDKSERVLLQEEVISNPTSVSKKKCTIQ